MTLIKKAKKDYNDKINLSLAKPSISAKKWWSIIKSVCSNKHCSSIWVLLDGGKLISDSKQKTQVFNNYFVSQTQLPNSALSKVPALSSSSSSLSHITANEISVLNLLLYLNISKASGHDGISNKILKISSSGIYKPLTRLTNLSLFLGQYPSS